MDMEATATKSDAHIDVYSLINERIIEQLEKGTAPWRKPWTDNGMPQNIITKKPYRGLNLMLLAMAGYEQNYFITFKQLKAIGGKVKKDEKGHPVIFWKNAEQAPEGETDRSEKGKPPVLRYYTVFNISQCENIPDSHMPPPFREARDIPTCEEIVKNMPSCPPIKHKEQKAYYNPLEDFVNMPKKGSFKSDESYYCTLFHELVHSTGHHSRLNRMALVQMSEFGGEEYSHEELVAEIGTCYLQSFVDIQSEFTQSTAYIHGWLQRLRNDKRFIFSAANQAQKAVDYILNIKEEVAEEE